MPGPVVPGKPVVLIPLLPGQHFLTTAVQFDVRRPLAQSFSRESPS